MIKSIIAVILISLLVIIAMPYSQMGLHGLLAAHDWIDATLKSVFSDGQAGNISRQLIALLCIPLLVGLFPALIYWFAKRRWFPYFMDLVWITWLVQTSALVILTKVGS